MMRKVAIIDPGDSKFLQGEFVSRLALRMENSRLLDENKQPAEADPLLLGITKAALEMDSFIAAASFQETTKVLTKATISGSKDRLLGLKENVIMGRLIPSGTGALHLRNLEIKDEDAEDDTIAENSRGNYAVSSGDFEEIDDELE
jgi:DNA-directed RNA polymerase subunit beta'